MNAHSQVRQAATKVKEWEVQTDSDSVCASSCELFVLDISLDSILYVSLSFEVRDAAS
jgi:hypothetical protein